MDGPEPERGKGVAIPVAAAGGESQETYRHLIQRAVAFVSERGGEAHEDILIRHVFGGAGSAALWRSLLRRVLGADDELVLRADGYWTQRARPSQASPPLLTEYVVLDVETTGLRPANQRIIEVAAIQYRDGEVVQRFETLCNPGKRLPKYIADLTGIRDIDLAEAPTFGMIVDELLQVIGSTVIAGHNVEFDLGFLNVELQRLDRPRLINERIDTMGLAVGLLPKIRKPNLASVARELGIEFRSRDTHRAGADAVLTGEVFARLIERAREQGADSLDALKAHSAGRPGERPKSLGRGRAVLDQSLIQDIPKAPGVYVMRDAFDHVIYVGKAKNLRDRVRSYYSQPLGYTRKMDGLLEAIARIEVEVAGSELAALLLESQLIKRYQPRFNTAMRSSDLYPYIRLDVANPWPRLTLAKMRKDDGARYFGPFRNTSGARKTVELINRVVPLRTCSRSFKTARSYGAPCLELDLGRCLGPCVGKADREQYAGLVEQMAAFLDGRDDALYELLWRDLEAAAARLDFERAARLRRDLLQVNGVVAAQRRLREAQEFHTLLIVLPAPEAGCRELVLVVQGRPWARFLTERTETRDSLATRLAASWARLPSGNAVQIDHDTLDECSIIHRWLYQHSGHPTIVSLPSPPEEPDWEAVVGKAEALLDADFDLRPRSDNQVPESETVEDIPLAAGPDIAGSPLVPAAGDGAEAVGW